MTKKDWRKPEVTRLEAGRAEGIPGNVKRDTGAPSGTLNKS